MSGASPSPKIGLDARAAELKEKLLRGRGLGKRQTSAKPAQPSADGAEAGPKVAAGAPSKASSAGSPSSEGTKPSSSQPPQEVTKPPTLVSLPADADDIAALISSISAAATEVPDGDNNMLSTDVQKTTPTAPAAPASGLLSEPPKPAPKISFSIAKTSIPAAVAVASQNKLLPMQPSASPQALPSAKQSTQLEPRPTEQRNGTATAAVKTPSKSLANESPEQGEVTTPARKNGNSTGPAAPEISTARTASETTDHKDNKERKSPVERTAPDACHSQPAIAPLVKRESVRAQTGPAPTKPSNRDLPDSRNKPRTFLPKPEASTELRTTAATSTGAEQSTTNGKHTSRSEPVSSDDAFTRLLNQVPDLKDFLEMTDYYNVEARTRKLDRFRRVKALAAEKLRIEEEERKLMEEEELEMGLQRSTVARLTSAVSSAAPALETNSLPTPVTPAPPSSKGMGEVKEEPQTNPAKRARDEDNNTEVRQEKVPRLEAPPPRRSASRPREDDRRDARDDRYRQSPLTRPRSREYDDYDYRKYDSHKGDDGRYRDSGRRPSYPIRVDLGRKGDTRFFILKSFNEANVRRSMEDNLWTTQNHNAKILAEAYAQCKNVILFFSINKSKAFQGYARMTSPPSPSIPRPTFKGAHWDPGDPFRVQWLSKTAVEFFRIGHLKNAYNDYLPVLVGKDGQEIEEGCGADLLAEMEDFAVAAGEEGGAGAGGGYYGGKGEGYYEGRKGSGGGGYYEKRYGKREGEGEWR